MTASAEMNHGVSFVLNVDGNQEVIKLDLVNHFKQTCGIDDEEIVYLKSFNNPEKFHIMFSYSKLGSVTPKSYSSVNLLPVDGGGTHINIFYEIIRDLFNDLFISSEGSVLIVCLVSSVIIIAHNVLKVSLMGWHSRVPLCTRQDNPD